LALASKTIADRPLFGCVIGPFSLAGRLCDMTQIFMKLIEEPEMVHVVLEKCTRFLIDYAKAFKDAGAQGIFIAEPAAGLISPRQCQQFSSNYVKQIIASVKDENFTAVLHNCGNTRKLVPAMLDTGAHGYHFGNAVDMNDILPQIPPEILAFGNIDPSSILRNGTTDEVKTKTIELLERVSGYQNFVPSSGCDIPPGTPVKNIEAFFTALNEFC
jgi:uroporphyrinogen decarboxylase